MKRFVLIIGFLLLFYVVAFESVHISIPEMKSTFNPDFVFFGSIFQESELEQMSSKNLALSYKEDVLLNREAVQYINKVLFSDIRKKVYAKSPVLYKIDKQILKSTFDLEISPESEDVLLKDIGVKLESKPFMPMIIKNDDFSTF